jgi:D-glycero-alpha-D-manno-heptose-7-phosphate kinase
MIISETPLRISLSGGGTDLPNYYLSHEGAVVSTAIDKYLYVIVKERFDDLIYVDYSQKEIILSVDEIQHDLVREAARKTGLKKGFEVMMLADIPSEGSGLGSSSSLTVGLLNAFYQYQGILVTSEQLAAEACEIEIDILKRPIGKQDQYIAAYGGLKKFIQV